MGRTIVLVGRTGNGKSATGNSILGKKAFNSRASSSSVTNASEMQTSLLPDGQPIHIIDTPGLFDPSARSDYIEKEIVKCNDLAKDGIHAIVLVFSVRFRFSREEEAAFRRLQNMFGTKIVDYTILVFTGGDELEDNGETLEDYLDCDCPELKDMLALCKNRCVLFDNKTRDAPKMIKQVHQLLSIVDENLKQNGGQPYTKLKEEDRELCDHREVSRLKELQRFKQLKIAIDMNTVASLLSIVNENTMFLSFVDGNLKKDRQSCADSKLPYAKWKEDGMRPCNEQEVSKLKELHSSYEEQLKLNTVVVANLLAERGRRRPNAILLSRVILKLLALRLRTLLLCGLLFFDLRWRYSRKKREQILRIWSGAKEKLLVVLRMTYVIINFFCIFDIFSRIDQSIENKAMEAVDIGEEQPNI